MMGGRHLKDWKNGNLAKSDAVREVAGNETAAINGMRRSASAAVI